MKKIQRTIRRRRKEGKTDYKARYSLLKSKRPRAIVRKTNRYIIGQIIESEVAQDKIIIGAHSKELLNKGWPDKLQGSLKSLAACYLTGYLLGKKSKDIKEAIIDFGLQRNIKKSRLFAFIKGLIDAGVKVPHKPASLPTEEDLEKNEKTRSLISKVKEEISNG